MDLHDIRTYILNNFAGADVADDEGNLFFFFDPVNKIPFASIVTTDKYDKFSNLDRLGIYRLNIGIGKESFRSMFPTEKLPAEAGYDFTAIDDVMPHPQYGRIFWICVLNPGRETFEKLRPLLAEAYRLAVKKYETARAARSNAA